MKYGYYSLRTANDVYIDFPPDTVDLCISVQCTDNKPHLLFFDKDCRTVRDVLLSDIEHLFLHGIELK